jgi:hypothetical protein
MQPVSPSAPWDAAELPAAGRSARRMASAARALLNALRSDQLPVAFYRALGDGARTKWSNFPAGMSPRAGLALGKLTDAQRILVHELLRESTSSQGYHKMTGAIRADDVLHDLQGEALFGAANYYVSVFGSPDEANWAWMLTGHHMSALFTVAGNRTAFTPMFTGAQPLRIPTGMHAGWSVLPHDADRAGTLLTSLSEPQKKVAVLAAAAPNDVLAGPGRQKSLSAFAGIPAGRLGDGQQRLLWLLVEEFVRNADAEAAGADWLGLHYTESSPIPGGH